MITNKYNELNQMEYAIIVFDDNSAIEKVMNKSTPNDFWGTYESHKERGLNKWLSDYKKLANLDAEVLQVEINHTLAKFDENELKRKRTVESSSVTDSDGWIIVTANNKMRKVDSKTGISVGVISKSQTSLLERRSKEKKHELTDFYKFQNREHKKNRIDELQERFEQDKKRLEKMKAARKFIKL